MAIDPQTLAEARTLVINAGMEDFTPASEAHPGSGQCLVAIAFIDPPVRGVGVPNFDKPDIDRPDVVRSTSILNAIREGVPLPAVLLFQRAGESRFELREGFHRLHLCAALGFTHMWADVTDWKPGEPCRPPL